MVPHIKGMELQKRVHYYEAEQKESRKKLRTDWQLKDPEHAH